jgi:hypothetical protein
MATKKDKDDFFDNLMKQKIISLPAQYAPVYNMASYPPMQSGSASHVHSFNLNGIPIHTQNPPSTYGEWLGEIHILKIINYAEDVGQDGYQEELDWELGHSLECPRAIDYEEQITDYMKSPKIRPINFECEMAMEIKRHGLSRLEMDWMQIEPGEYRVQLEVSKDYTINSSSSWASTQQKVYDLPCRIRLL